jgi:hypothetical protein
MALIPEPPFPKAKGDDIRAQDWNAVVQEVQRLEGEKINRAGGDVHGHLRFNGSNNQRLSGAVRAGQQAVVLSGNWDELEVKGRVLDWTGTNLHIGFANNHATHNIFIGEKVGQTIFYSGGGATETMRLSQGNVSIGGAVPAVKLHVLGNRIRLQKSGTTQTLDLRADGAAFDIESTGADLYLNNNNVPVRIRNLVQGSSRQWKEDIATLSTQEARHILERLKPSSFSFKDDASHQRHLGFVAEEVPTSAATPDQQGYSPTAIIAVLTQVVQEQQQQLARLREEVALLTARVSAAVP